MYGQGQDAARETSSCYWNDTEFICQFWVTVASKIFISAGELLNCKKYVIVEEEDWT